MKPSLLEPELPIQGTDQKLVNFWQWAYSDILSNRNRGILAEFIVATALNQTSKPRIEWDPADVLFQNHWIEVKSAAYIQSWEQKTPSIIQFDISPSKTANVPRIADCYVFSLYTGEDQDPQKVLDLSLWFFFVLPTKTLNKQFPHQKKLGISSLEALVPRIQYDSLRSNVEAALNFA